MRITVFFLLMILGVSCITTIKIEPEEDTTDILRFYNGPLGDLYQLDSQGDFSLLDESLDKILTYNNRLSGNFTMADVSNPQRLLLYAPYNNKIQFLDNSLAELESVVIPFDLYPDVPVVALSNDNQFWFWDAVNQQIVKMKHNLEVISTSNMMYDYGLNVRNVNHIEEKANHVYVQIDDAVLVFDNFGNYLNKVRVDALGSISFNTHSISYFNRQYQWMTITMPLMNEVATPPINIIDEKPNDIIKVMHDIYIIYDDKVVKKAF